MEFNQDKHKFSNIDLNSENQTKANFNIKIIGVGGAGCNVINHIQAKHPNISQAARLYAFNTDLGSLKLVKNVDNLLLLNKEELKGYGSGGDPEIGRRAVEHDASIIKEELKGTDVLFIIAGMGKGAGSGGAPELAKIAKELGILTVAVVNMPSTACEGNAIYNNAFNSLQTLISFADSVSTISSERIINNNPSISFYEAYELANEEIGNLIEDLIHVIFKPSIMNIDFADLRTFFLQNKFFMMNRLTIDTDNISQNNLKDALSKKIRSSFSDVNIENSKHVICNINMSKNTQTSFVNDLKRSFADITRNETITLVAGVDYNSSDNIKISFLISGTNFANDFTSEYVAEADAIKFHEPTVNVDESIGTYDDLLKEIDAASSPTEDLLNKENKQ